MKIVAIVPIKKKSLRVKNKNFRLINKKPLYQYTLEKLKYCNFDEFYVDSDSDKVRAYCKKNKIKFIERLSKLSSKNANGNELLLYHSKIIKAEVYFQIFVTSPLLKISTINNCINRLKKNIKKYDSILTIQKIYSWFWFNKKPINYNPRVLPRSQDARPMILETTGLYGITKKSLFKYKSRIGKKPFFYEVSDDENIDLDNEKDFRFLEFVLNSKN
jgi:N-acylneuraminate cytidylyltransferase